MYLKASDVINEASTDASSTAPPPVDLSETSIIDEHVVWIFIDCSLFIVIVLGNVLTILAIAWVRRLRNIVSNYFILNLAVSDLLVGVSLPYYLAFYTDGTLNRNKSVCISRFVMINLGCGGSIYNLIAIAVDRYIAIVHPLSYNAYATRRRVLLIIIVAWICTIGVSSIPLYWNCFDTAETCELETVLPSVYIVAVQMSTFFLSWIVMYLLYWKIWKEARMHARRMNLSAIPNITEKNDRKSIQVVLLILGCFSISWFPYFIVACIRTFGLRTNATMIWYKSLFALAVANSGMNPFIYAWKNANFRKAFQKMLRFKSPNDNFNSSFKIYLEKQRELKSQQTDVESDIHRISGNGNSHGYPSGCRSSRAEENKIDDAIL